MVDRDGAGTTGGKAGQVPGRSGPGNQGDHSSDDQITP